MQTGGDVSEGRFECDGVREVLEVELDGRRLGNEARAQVAGDLEIHGLALR